MKTKLATISILTPKRQSSAKKINEVLSNYGQNIIARLGVHLGFCRQNFQEGLIVVTIEAESVKIKELLKSLEKISGVKAKCSILN